MSKAHSLDQSESIHDSDQLLSIKKQSDALEKKSKQHFHFETKLLEIDDIVYKMQEILGYEFVSRQIKKAENKVTPKVIKEIFKKATVNFLLSEDEKKLLFKSKTLKEPIIGFTKLTVRKAFKKFSIEQLRKVRELGILHVE